MWRRPKRDGLRSRARYKRDRDRRQVSLLKQAFGGDPRRRARRRSQVAAKRIGRAMQRSVASICWKCRRSPASSLHSSDFWPTPAPKMNRDAWAPRADVVMSDMAANTRPPQDASVNRPGRRVRRCLWRRAHPRRNLSGKSVQAAPRANCWRIESDSPPLATSRGRLLRTLRAGDRVSAERPK